MVYLLHHNTITSVGAGKYDSSNCAAGKLLLFNGVIATIWFMGREFAPVQSGLAPKLHPCAWSGYVNPP